MKITHPGVDILSAATNGDLASIDTLLRAIQPGVFNLCVRMLGNRDDAADACQEILLKVITHLSSFRGEANFTTWVFQIARFHLLNAITKSAEHPVLSFDAIGEKLSAGLEFDDAAQTDRTLTPEEKTSAKQIAIACTQSFLMALDRDHRIAYLLDTIFGLTSEQAATVLEISPSSFRKRLSRANAALNNFTQGQCGLVSPTAACHCEKQLGAVNRAALPASNKKPTHKLIAILPHELAGTTFESIVRLSEASALFRAHPEYHAPGSMRDAIRAILKREGQWPDGSAAAQH